MMDDVISIIVRVEEETRMKPMLLMVALNTLRSS